jgi:hypothetical protein
MVLTSLELALTDVRDLRADLADARRTVRAAVQVDRSITEHNTT